MSLIRVNRIWTVLLIAALPVALIGQEAKPPSASEAAAIASADAGSLEKIVEKLSPVNQLVFGEMLAEDWKDRPEWAEMLIAMLKREPPTLGVGWFQPGVPKYDWKWLAEKLDANKDDMVSKDELPKERLYPDLFFSRMDRDSDGTLRPADFEYFNRQPPTTPQTLSRFLSAVLDADSNGRITPEELQDWLKEADRENTGFLTADDLLDDFNSALAVLNSAGDDMPSPDRMLPMFFRGELGVWGAGPKQGEDAPDFTLPTHDGKETFTLSKSRGKPVILIFGSFT